MTAYEWKKSSYSPDGSNCVSLALAPDGSVRLRDSKVPDVVVVLGASALREFVDGVKLRSRTGW